MTEMYGDVYEFLDEGDSQVSSAVYGGEDVLIIEFEPTITVVTTPSPEFIDLTETGPGGGGGVTSYTHIQSIAAATWTVVHNLNTVRTPQIVLDSAPDEIVYTSVEVIDLDTLVLTFDSPVTGKAYL
jgi:hypothetical protein